MLCSIFSSILVLMLGADSVSLRQKFRDNHPFVDIDQIFINSANKIGKFMLIPSIGYEKMNSPGQYTLVPNGWCYQPMDPNYVTSLITTTFQAALFVLDPSDSFSDAEKEERLAPFFVRDIQNQKLELLFSASYRKEIITDNNGRFREEINVELMPDFHVKQQVLKYTASIGSLSEQVDDGILYLMQNKPDGGCSIISDIDDTIKISNVPNKEKLIVNTFKKNFTAVPGMSAVYRSWQSSHGCLLHYVSAMPSQLYYATQKFLNQEKFPGGSFHMRHLKLADKDKADLIQQLLEFIKHDASLKHKLVAIRDILDHAPKKQEFIMVGDSGELDPEIYGQIARDYPTRIKMIYIRLVDGGKNDQIRFENAFKDVPKNKWQSFVHADKLPMKLYDNKPVLNLNGLVTGNAEVLSLSLFLTGMSTFVSFRFRRDV